MTSRLRNQAFSLALQVITEGWTDGDRLSVDSFAMAWVSADRVKEWS